MLSGAAAGCREKKAELLPEWTPADHDSRGNPSPGQVDTQARRTVQADTPTRRPGMPNLSQHGIDDVVLATWKQSCTPCHGLIGRGDGPQGAMLRPTDLTSAAFQERAIDSEMAYAIKKGRGRMPAFGHLPDSTIEGLVRLVRLLGPAKPAPPGPAPPEKSPAP